MTVHVLKQKKSIYWCWANVWDIDDGTAKAPLSTIVLKTERTFLFRLALGVFWCCQSLNVPLDLGMYPSFSLLLAFSVSSFLSFYLVSGKLVLHTMASRHDSRGSRVCLGAYTEEISTFI